MSSLDPNLYTIRISKLAALHVVQKPDQTEITLCKQNYQRVGQRMVLVKTEVQLTYNEIELLAEAAKLVEHFSSISERASRSLPPIPPQRFFTSTKLNDTSSSLKNSSINSDERAGSRST